MRWKELLDYVRFSPNVSMLFLSAGVGFERGRHFGSGGDDPEWRHP